ncbi:MAG: ABC transporter ATP-binding protein [Gemmatimonadaceae bacterium]|nr:ABC transporter ATP-binding protein [Gemmatimonadaceae bacterium]
MTAALDVEDLWVFFRGEAQRTGTSVSALMFDPQSIAGLHVPNDHRIGLARVAFSVQGGDCLAVLGTSGSGKSSLLRTLAGLEIHRRGSIRVSGRDVATLPPEQRGIVYLHQEPVLFPHLSVLRNVAFPLTLRGVNAAEAERRAVEMLARLQVGELAGNAADALSGGQRHRVALARALCADPAVLLLDEPLSSLDPAVRRDVREALLAVRQASGAAMVIVTHDLDDAMAVATHIGAIGQFGDLSTPVAPADMLDAPGSLETARLLGVYAEVAGTVVGDGAGATFHWIGGVIPAAGATPGPTVACVRSHEVRVHPGDLADAPRLAVVERREAAQDTQLVVQSVSGVKATVRVGSGVLVPQDRVVQIVIHRARFFSSR